MANTDVSPRDPTRQEHLRFQRRLWKVERASWWVQLGLVLAALAGLTGKGPLSRVSAESQGLRVEYDRLARHESAGELTLTVAPGLARGGVVRLRLERRWLEGVEIQGIDPEPERSEAGADTVRFTFPVPEGQAARVRLRVEYSGMGWRSGRLQVESGPGVTLTQWVFP